MVYSISQLECWWIIFWISCTTNLNQGWPQLDCVWSLVIIACSHIGGIRWFLCIWVLVIKNPFANIMKISLNIKRCQTITKEILKNAFVLPYENDNKMFCNMTCLFQWTVCSSLYMYMVYYTIWNMSVPRYIPSAKLVDK